MIKKIIRKIYVESRNYCYRLRLKNRNFTILAPTCIGGVICHNLKQPFLTPTINLWLTEADFYKFVSNLDYYLFSEVEFYKTDETYGFPVGIIRDREEGIKINFNHHKEFEAAKKDWDRRKVRVVKDNLFVIASTRNGESEEFIEKWENLADQVRGLVIFTAKEYPQYKHTLPLVKYKGASQVGSYMVECPTSILDRSPWEFGFDYVSWLNK